MARIGMSWPIPEGLDRNRNAEELQAALHQHDEEARTDFISAGAQRLSGP